MGVYHPRVVRAAASPSAATLQGRASPSQPPEHHRAATISAFGSIGIPAGPAAEWVHRRVTPHPIGAYETPLELRNPVGNGRPCTYVSCTAPQSATIEASRRWVKSQDGWIWVELAAGHCAHVTVPEDVVRLLAGIG